MELLESRVLLSGVFDNAAMAGPWALAGMGAAGSIHFDDSGEIDGGSLLRDDGATDSPAGTYTINGDGTLSIEGTLTGAMSASHDVIAVGSSGSNFALALLLNGGGQQFSNADLAGTWQISFDGATPGSTIVGTIVFNGQGGITGGKLTSGLGKASISSGSYLVDAGGACTIQVNIKAGKSPAVEVDLVGALNAGKDLLALDAADLQGAAQSGGPRMAVAVRSSGRYSAADAAGTWTIATDQGPGTLTLDGKGKITAGSISTAAGVENITGTCSLSSSGALTLRLAENGRTLTLTGALNGERSTAVVNRTSKDAGDSDNLMLMVRSANHAPTLTAVTRLAGAVAGQDFTLPFADLLDAANAQDVDGDAIRLQVTFSSNGTLLLNGDPAPDGPFLVGPDDTLDWTPAPGVKGTITAFTVKASDGDLLSAAEIPVTVTTVLPPTITLTASRPAASEINDGKSKGVGVFTFTRANGDLSQPLSLTYDLSGTAENGDDYAPLFGTVDFAPGQKSVAVQVIPVSDGLAEGPETVILTLEEQEGVAFVNSNATITIADGAPTISIVANKAAASEINNGTTTGIGQFTITRTGGSTSDPFVVTVDLQGTAGQGSDYTLSEATPIVIPAGKTSVTVNLLPVDDFEIEGPETAIIALDSDGSFLVDPAKSQATVTIADDNRVPTVTESTPLAGAVGGTPFDISSDLLAFATGAHDPEGQPLVFTITKVLSGTLTMNGTPVVPGTTTVHDGDTVTWTSAPEANGTLAAFVVTVSDGVNTTSPLTISVIVV